MGFSNIIDGNNPPFERADFFEVFPQFSQIPYLSDYVLDMFITMADAAVKEQRWHSFWNMGMGLFIAHFVTLWLQAYADPDGDASAVIAAGESRGLIASEAVDGVSVAIDNSAISTDLDGWAAWKLTTYGTQYATLAKTMVKGGMYVW